MRVGLDFKKVALQIILKDDYDCYEQYFEQLR